MHRAPVLPPGIAFSNGRLEADEIDIATKFPGRVAQILVDDGTMVRAGQVVARLDTRDLEAQLAQAKAQTDQARQSILQQQANLVQMGTQLKLTVQQLQRAKTLAQDGYGTLEMLDQRQSQFNMALSAYCSADLRSACSWRNW